MGSVTGEKNDKVSKLDGDAPESTDFANYFCTYAYLYHQKDMLEDHIRTGAYYKAVMMNKNLFQDSIVLDVGTGSGILAYFAAIGGAKKVYAVEATDMAKYARTLMKANKVDGVVEVIQGTMETVEIPEKVDIIISEWMGYFLLRESMLDSVLIARDKYLKPGGSLFPSHARMYLTPVKSQSGYKKKDEFHGAVSSWHQFMQEMQDYYGIDMSCLSKEYIEEQRRYYLCTAQWSEIHPSQLLSPPLCFKEYDLLKVTLDELKEVVSGNVDFKIAENGTIEALAGFFDVSFCGSVENPAQHPIVLSTAPEANSCTHWGQLSFYLQPPMDCDRNSSVNCDIAITRRTDNHRLMNVKFELKNKHVKNNHQSINYMFQIE